MKMKLADPDAAYRTPVEISVPGPDGPAPHECAMDFRLADADELLRLAAEGNAAMFEALVLGWDGIGDHEGRPLEFSAENRAKLARIPYFCRAALDAYHDFAAGLPGKTSTRSPDASPRGATT